MNHGPVYEGDYTNRQVEAARRVLVDVARVLASFCDGIVVQTESTARLSLPKTLTALSPSPGYVAAVVHVWGCRVEPIIR
jgi:hypothetical protein